MNINVQSIVIWSTSSVMLLTSTACRAPSELVENMKPCDGSVMVSVSTGSRPRFDWSPQCTVYGVQVIEAESKKGVWGTRNAENTLVPGVPFGGADPLTPGLAYTVIVEILVGGDGIGRLGSKVFTP